MGRGKIWSACPHHCHFSLALPLHEHHLLLPLISLGWLFKMYGNCYCIIVLYIYLIVNTNLQIHTRWRKGGFFNKLGGGFPVICLPITICLPMYAFVHHWLQIPKHILMALISETKYTVSEILIPAVKLYIVVLSALVFNTEATRNCVVTTTEKFCVNTWKGQYGTWGGAHHNHIHID